MLRGIGQDSTAETTIAQVFASPSPDGVASIRLNISKGGKTGMTAVWMVSWSD